MINSSSTEDSSFTKSSEIKVFVDVVENEEEDGFKEIRDKKKAVGKDFAFSRRLPTTFKYQCFVRNIFEKFGSLFIFDRNNTKIFISKIRIVNFQMNKQIFEKGKEKERDGLNKFNKSTIPDIKFWHQRYYYYSKFDEGIKMDYESWYSVTPEELARYIALAITNKNSIVVDAFCGSGGNVIQADFIFLSPPWGGVEYKDSEFYSIKNMMTPNIYDIIKVCLNIGKKIIFYFPRTTMLSEFYEILDDILKDEKYKKVKDKYIYTDIHILNSANKIKAVMLVFGLNVDEDVSSLELKNYLKFYHKSLLIDDSSLIALINISKCIGLPRFLRAEYAFRINQEKNLRLTPIKILIKFFKTEIMNDSDLRKFDILQNLSKLEKKQTYDENNNHFCNIRNNLPWKNKTYFVDGKIMNEEIFHKYRDNMFIN